MTSPPPGVPDRGPADTECPLVLIVDDSEKNLKLARDVLRAAGFRTLEATSGAEGIALAAKHLPEVVLMDLQLSDMDGMEAVRKLAAGARTARIPIVALSAHPLEGGDDWLLAAGFAGYLEKPFSVSVPGSGGPLLLVAETWPSCSQAAGVGVPASPPNPQRARLARSFAPPTLAARALDESANACEHRHVHARLCSATRTGTERRLTIMRTFLIGGAMGVLVVLLAACGGSSISSATQQALQQKSDFWEIDQIEKKFHKATTTKNIDLMMSLWSPNATLTVGPAKTASGKKEIRQYWLEKSVAFKPTNHWISDHPAYKVRITVNGDRGTLHFECHYIDAKTGEVALTTVADQDVARINGHWLTTNMVAGSTALTP